MDVSILQYPVMMEMPVLLTRVPQHLVVNIPLLSVVIVMNAPTIFVTLKQDATIPKLIVMMETIVQLILVIMSQDVSTQQLSVMITMLVQMTLVSYLLDVFLLP